MLKLKVATFKHDGGVERHDAIDAHVIVNRSDLEDQVWPQIITIDVCDGAKMARFNVRLNIRQAGRGSGRPTAEISTPLKTGKGNKMSTSKSVTGSYWLDNHHNG